MKKPSLIIPLALIIIGAIWFLNATHILPATSVMIAIGLAIAGVAVIAMDGLNKQSVVAGPFLVYLGAAIYLRTQEFLPLSPLLALGMMVLGMLLLLARSNIVPPKIYQHGVRIDPNAVRAPQAPQPPRDER